MEGRDSFGFTSGEALRLRGCFGWREASNSAQDDRTTMRTPPIHETRQDRVPTNVAIDARSLALLVKARGFGMTPRFWFVFGAVKPRRISMFQGRCRFLVVGYRHSSVD